MRFSDDTSGSGWRPSASAVHAATWLRVRMSIARPRSRANSGVVAHQLLDVLDRRGDHLDLGQRHRAGEDPLPGEPDEAEDLTGRQLAGHDVDRLAESACPERRRPRMTNRSA